MKARQGSNTQRLNCKIRADIKAALEELALKRNRAEGGYVGLTRIMNEAALLLLEREGIALVSEAEKSAPVARRRQLAAQRA